MYYILFLIFVVFVLVLAKFTYIWIGPFIEYFDLILVLQYEWDKGLILHGLPLIKLYLWGIKLKLYFAYLNLINITNFKIK